MTIRDDPKWTEYMTGALGEHADVLHTKMSPLLADALNNGGTIDGSVRYGTHQW